MLSQATEDLRKALYNYLSKQGTYVCHEVEIPTIWEHFERTGVYRGRVDMMTYQKSYRQDQATIRCYELKVSYTDFHSTHGHNFIGDYNYYVVPRELYPKIQNEIPDGVGCLIPQRQKHNGDWIFECVKKPKKRQLACDYNKLIHNFICALSRECCIKNVGRYKAR